jgi:hypothetical protein
LQSTPDDGIVVGRVTTRKLFDYLTPITSAVLPQFTTTVEDILRE